MKFTIPFVSLIAAFALASGVAACDGGYPPPNSTPVSQCNTANTYCCDTYTSSSNPLAALLATLLGIININPSLGVGLSCTQIGINSACSETKACCSDVHQNGLVNVACTPISV